MSKGGDIIAIRYVLKGSDEHIQFLLEDALRKEHYEDAAKYRDELRRRKPKRKRKDRSELVFTQKNLE